MFAFWLFFQSLTSCWHHRGDSHQQAPSNCWQRNRRDSQTLASSSCPKTSGYFSTWQIESSERIRDLFRRIRHKESFRKTWVKSSNPLPSSLITPCNYPNHSACISLSLILNQNFVRSHHAHSPHPCLPFLLRVHHNLSLHSEYFLNVSSFFPTDREMEGYLIDHVPKYITRPRHKQPSFTGL